MPFSSLRLPLYASAALLLAASMFHGCKKPQAGDAHTLNAPSDITGVGVCIYPDGDVLVAEDASSENCIHAAELTPGPDDNAWDPHLYLAAISNYGENALQIYSLDTRSTIWLSALRSPEAEDCLAQEVAVRQPTERNGQWIAEANGDHPCSSIIGTGIRSFDNLPGTPGNNGIRLDGQIEKNTAAHFPGIQWVATSGPNTLAAVNLLSGKRVQGSNGAEQHYIDHPVSALASVKEGGWLIAANPRDNELVAYQPTFHCNGQSERYELGCDLEVDLGTPTTIALEGSPRHIAASAQGDVYVSAESVPYLTRVSLNDDECPTSSPCKIPLTHTCNDGIDNDGNGLIDAEDPSCYAPWMEEGETFQDAECADGEDNDGDGLIDAQDPKCLWRNYGAEDGSDNSCSDGIDNDGDGLIDDDDPKCADGSEFPDGSGFTPPEEIDVPRYESTPVYPGPIAVSQEGDIVIVGENGGNRAEEGGPADLVFLCGRPLEDDQRHEDHPCDTPNTLLKQNEGDPARNKGVGLQLPAAVQSIVISNRVERLPIENPNGISSDSFDPELVSLTTRRAYVTATDGRIYSVDLDEGHDFVDNDGNLEQAYTPLFQYTDRTTSYADVRNMRLRLAERVPSLPDDATPAPAPSPGLQPSLRAIDPDELRLESNEGETFLSREHLTTPEAFIRLPREERFCFVTRGLGCLTNPPRDKQFYPYSFERERTSVKHDARVIDENWTLAWEGNLPIAPNSERRSDAVLLDDDGWIHFLGQDSCEVVDNDSQRLCDMNFGWSVCPDLRDRCERGADLCGDNIDICDLCPRACDNEVDLCQAGVQPGDIAIIPPMEPNSYCLRHEENCNSQTDIPAECLDGHNGDDDEPGAYGTEISGQVTNGNEYRVVEVRGNSFRVEPLDFTDRSRYRLPTTLPSTSCYRKPFSVEVIAANRWSLHGARIVGVDSPYINVDNACVYEVDTDDDLRNWRPVDGETLLTRYGFEFHIEPGDYLHYCRTQADNPEECAHALRGFRVSFASEDNLTPRTLPDLVGHMGIASDRVTNLNELTNQLLFIDAGYNQFAIVDDDANLRGIVVP